MTEILDPPMVFLHKLFDRLEELDKRIGQIEINLHAYATRDEVKSVIERCDKPKERIKCPLCEGDGQSRAACCDLMNNSWELIPCIIKSCPKCNGKVTIE